MQLRVMVSRHSAFYSPLISTVAAGFLAKEGLDATYQVLPDGQRSHDLIRQGAVHIMQSAVSSNWKVIEQGVTGLPVHFAQINRRDGFFIAGRHAQAGFDLKELEGKTLLADHGLQPLAMLKYAVHYNGVDWNRINIVNAGAPDQMQAAFENGLGDLIQRQAPGIGVALVSVGASMPEVAFSSLCASREFMATPEFQAFLRAYRSSRLWVREADCNDVARKQAIYFPGVDVDRLAASVAQYQQLGCWSGDIEIPCDLYEQALNVFEFAGEITSRPPYDVVVGSPGSEANG